jgi:cytochrome b561
MFAIVLHRTPADEAPRLLMAPTRTRYSPPAIALHWLAAALILTNLAFGLWMAGLPLSPQKLRYLSWHKWIGITVLLLSAARLAWRLGHEPPALPATMKRWEAFAARASHALLYVLFFAAPLSGWLYSSAAGIQTVYLGLVPIPDLLARNREWADVLKIVHRGINYSMAALIVVHAAAALKHHWIDRDDVLVRMLPRPGKALP